MAFYKANDKYSAVLTAGYTVGQSTLYVSAVPENVPTLIVAAKGTDKETVFGVTGKTTNSLTGVSRLRGANVDLDAQTPLTCLNNEEFINQFGDAFLEEHAQDGTHDPTKVTTRTAFETEHKTDNTHDETKVAMLAGAQTFTGQKTFSGGIKTDTIDEKTTNAGVTVDGLLIKDGAIANWDGWMPAGETWTYASATSFTVSGDVTAKYPKGTKIKLTQTTVKYFYVIGTSYSAPNTTITITGGSDYSLANAAITDNYYSYVSSPQGFPDWFNYTPTLGATGSMTFTSTTIQLARFKIIGSMVTAAVAAIGTTGGTASNGLTFTHPVAANATWDDPSAGLVSGTLLDGSTYSGWGYLSNTTTMVMLRYDRANLGLGANRGFGVVFSYQF